IGETFSWLGEALLALERIQKTGLPSMITMCFEANPMSYEGYDPGECARRLRAAGADIVGINCLRNPKYALPLIKQMRDAVSGYIACQPAAYRTPRDFPDFTSLPEFPYELDPLQLSRYEMADFAAEARNIGVNYIGSCCGSVAVHVREMAQALGKIEVKEREWKSKNGRAMSAYEYYGHER
ncbi:MAG TPA: homocysteine S-methyltransferase family protein, partial [Acidobacteriota bacterium]